MATVQTSAETTSPAQALREATAQCDRFLGGHGPIRPREALGLLVASTEPDERSDNYGQGPLIADFEREIADLLGKEAAVFAPSGTMVQQIALRIWCDRSGRRTVAFHPKCHLETHEEKGYQALHGLRSTLVGESHRLITMKDLQATAEQVGAVLFELPQRDIGGQLPTWDDLVAQIQLTRERGAAAHMDGARLWEAAPHYRRPHHEVAGLFDSVYVSFYKGLGALAGAALAGTEDFIAEARVWIRRHGGNVIHQFPFVISAREAMRRRLHRFPLYYDRAQSLAEALRSLPGISINPDPPQSSMMHVYLQGDRETLTVAAANLARESRVALFRSLQEVETPGYVFFELTIGDAGESITDGEVEHLFGDLMARAREGGSAG